MIEHEVGQRTGKTTRETKGKTAWWARDDSNLQPSGYAPVVCHCLAVAESYWDLNKIGVRSFILSGAPVNQSN
jgi:hypothetical protein